MALRVPQPERRTVLDLGPSHSLRRHERRQGESKSPRLDARGAGETGTRMTTASATSWRALYSAIHP